MSNILQKACLFRYIFVVVLLLGVFVKNAEKTFAAGENAAVAIKTGNTTATAKTVIKKKHSPESFSPFAALKQNFSTEATIPHVNFTLPQVVVSVLIKSFTAPANEAIPVYATIIRGVSFINQIVPITILPNAP